MIFQLWILLVGITVVMAVVVGPGDERLKMAFIENEVIPDVVFTPPRFLLAIKYTKSGKEVSLGNELTPFEVKEKPEVAYYAMNPNDFYSLVFTCPDSPSRQNTTRREFRLWLAVNIPGNDVSKAQDLTGYLGAGPGPTTGLHRYVFLLYKQPRRLDFDERVVTSLQIGDRPLFSTRNFAEKYNMVLEGGNFFQARYDDSVPGLHAALSP